jgi:2,3-bisphosphoglycerate-dependent phosphoglycerate mutase
MTTRIVFETHSTTTDNEQGIATGWLPGRLSTVGREQARELGQRRPLDAFAAVFSSDLARAVETTAIAFPDPPVPVLHDWRLRECDYGERNGTAAAALDRPAYVDRPYPGGESWQQAVDRVVGFLADLRRRWAGGRVLLVGHTATRWGLDHAVNGQRVADLVSADFDWQPGWTYELD